MSSTPQLRVGDSFGEQFSITRCLEQAPSLFTYEVSILNDASSRALLALMPLGEEDAISSVEARAQAIRELGTSRLLPLERTDDWDQYACFVSTAVSGHPLTDSWVKDWVALEQFHEVFARIGGALRTAHRAGLYHGWLTPQYIYIGEADPGAAWITDLGLAGIRRDSLRGGQSIVTAQLGELAYVAPELLALAHPANARADIYSFGALLYRALTGRSPFQLTNAIDFALHKRQVAPTTLQAIRPDLPVSVSQTIDRSLAADPGSRPASIDEMLHALRVLAVAYSPSSASTEELCRVWSASELRAAVLSQGDVQQSVTTSSASARDPATSSRPEARDTARKRTIVLVSAALALLASILAVVFLWRDQEVEKPALFPLRSQEGEQNSDWE